MYGFYCNKNQQNLHVQGVIAIKSNRTYMSKVFIAIKTNITYMYRALIAIQTNRTYMIRDERPIWEIMLFFQIWKNQFWK